MSIRMEGEKISNTIEFHRTQPSITLQQYVRKKRIILGKAISEKYRIYLDLRFWIFFREVKLGRNDDKDIVLLLSRIEQLVDKGLVICPISETVFLELMKQKDTETRLATAKLIDCLSSGVTLVVHHERISQELCNAIYIQAGADSDSLESLDYLVWTKLSYTFGETHPSETAFDEPNELVLQKAFFDHMWDVPLTEMLNYLDFDSWIQKDWQQTADRINTDNKNHSNEIRSYKQAYRVEFEGGLSLFKKQMTQLFKEVENRGFISFEESAVGLSKNERFSRFSNAVRTLHIGSCCYAAVRWDKKRQLTGNDLLDFHHAEAAIGYCNLFLTEKPLKTLVRQNHLKLMRAFSCDVESTVSGALSVLESIKG